MTDAASGMADAGRTPGAEFGRLVEVMDVLRSPGGCQWDAEQTHSSLLEYLIEEAYETVDAVESGNRDDLREELGDLLLQVVFHARIAEEDPDAPFGIDDVAAGIADKLVARHPHVFASRSGEESSAGPVAPDELAEATVMDDMEAIWQRRKAVEKGRTSITDGIPAALPAASLASKLVTRARRAGLGDDVLAGTVEFAEVDLPADESAYGDLLLALVANARAQGWDSEAVLRAASHRMRDRIWAAEALGQPAPGEPEDRPGGRA